MKEPSNYPAAKSFVLLLSFLFPFTSRAQSNTPPPIVIGVTLNESGGPVVYYGWPLLVRVTLMNENAYDDNVPVALSADWKNSIHFVVKDTAGNSLTWPFHLVSAPDENITLDSLTVAQLGYWLEPNEIQAFPAGDYTLTAALDSSAYLSLGDTLSSAESAAATVTISSTPDTSSVGQKTARDLLLANLSILKKDDATAMAYLNGILASNPDDLEALSLSGKLLEDQGDAGGALRAYSKGLKISYASNPHAVEPPVELLRAQNALYYKLDTAESFVVTLAAKDTSHPLHDSGSASCYYVDKIPFRVIELTRGKTYTFHMKDIPVTDPLYFSTSPRGGGVNPYTDGVTGAPADSNGTATITVTAGTPDVLYYQSSAHTFVGWRMNVTDSVAVTSVRDKHPAIPKEYSLADAYPNPFNPATTIKYALPKTSHVTLTIYDVLGEEVATLVNEEKAPGTYEVQWNAGELASGVFFYRIQAGSFVQTKKLILLK